MKNKTLAILGIVAYILTVLSSATNLEGVSTVSPIMIVVSGIMTFVFMVLAIIRLWKIDIFLSRAYTLSKAAQLVSETLFFVYAPQNGSPAMILYNVVKVISFVTNIWVIVRLFGLPNKEKILIGK